MHSRTTVIIPFCIVVLAITLASFDGFLKAEMIEKKNYEKVGIKYAELKGCEVLGKRGGDICFREGCKTIKLAKYESREDGSIVYRLILPNKHKTNPEDPDGFEAPWPIRISDESGQCPYLWWHLKNELFDYHYNTFYVMYLMGPGTAYYSMLKNETNGIKGLKFEKADYAGLINLYFITANLPINEKADFTLYVNQGNSYVYIYVGEIKDEPYKSQCDQEAEAYARRVELLNRKKKEKQWNGERYDSRQNLIEIDREIFSGSESNGKIENGIMFG